MTTETKHTPGPWFVGRIGDQSRWVDIYKLEDNGAHSLPFAACKHFNQEANARLIAAAPSLLKALEDLVEYVEERSRDNECRPLENAITAIAKATGETQ